MIDPDREAFFDRQRHPHLTRMDLEERRAWLGRLLGSDFRAGIIVSARGRPQLYAFQHRGRGV